MVGKHCFSYADDNNNDKNTLNLLFCIRKNKVHVFLNTNLRQCVCANTLCDCHFFFFFSLFFFFFFEKKVS